jgi:arylsulfatase A-like enzyme
LVFACIPGIEPRRIETQSGHIDLAPTIADLMGIKAEPPFHGQSLAPEFTGGEANPARHLRRGSGRSPSRRQRRPAAKRWPPVAVSQSSRAVVG